MAWLGFLGQDFLKEVDGIADEKGYVKVRDTYQTLDHDEVYAVGGGRRGRRTLADPHTSRHPADRFPTEVMAHTAASNIGA
jgi:sulfide:quinone oxidoreductase